MGIVNIDDELHDQMRKAIAVSCRSINAQAAFWIKIGMLCEMHPTLSFNQIMAEEMRMRRKEIHSNTFDAMFAISAIIDYSVCQLADMENDHGKCRGVRT